MKHSRIIVIALIAAVALSSCKSQFEALLNSNDVDLKYEAAFDLYNNGKYNKAASLFESLSMLTSGTERDDTVQYYWAMSNYRFKDYYTAEANFSRFVENYPRSPFTSEARFLRIDCLYRSTYRYELDQNPSYIAMTAISQYMAEYPNSTHFTECKDMMADLQERLDTKAYESARLYYKMEDYKAARVAFKNVLKNNSESQYREDILFYTAMSSYKYAKNSVTSKQRDRYYTFIDDYLNFVGELPESHYRKELDAMYKKSQKALGRDAVMDADTEIKEKAYEKERKEYEKALKKAQKENSKK